MALAKSNEIEPNNAINKKDQKALNDLKINEKLVHKNIADGVFDRAVSQLSNLLKECTCSVTHMCMKIEYLLKAYKFDDAAKYSAELMKNSHLSNNPRLLLWRGKVLTYTGADVVGKNHLQRAMQFDPDLKEGM